MPLLSSIRTYYGIHHAYSTKELKFNPVGDSSADMPPPDRPAPTVSPPAMTNVDQLEKEIELSRNTGIIYQAKPTNPG